MIPSLPDTIRILMHSMHADDILSSITGDIPFEYYYRRGGFFSRSQAHSSAA